jgi:hypothetical protein
VGIQIFGKTGPRWPPVGARVRRVALPGTELGGWVNRHPEAPSRVRSHVCGLSLWGRRQSSGIRGKDRRRPLPGRIARDPEPLNAQPVLGLDAVNPLPIR